MQSTSLTHSNWERYLVVAHVVSRLSIKERRCIFQNTRGFTADEARDIFFPQHGFTLAEFAVWHTLGDVRRKGRPQRRSV